MPDQRLESLSDWRQRSQGENARVQLAIGGLDCAESDMFHLAKDVRRERLSPA